MAVGENQLSVTLANIYWVLKIESIENVKLLNKMEKKYNFDVILIHT